MIWQLERLYKSVSECQREVSPGKWVPARPEPWPFMWRFRPAWLVLTGKADVVIWPEGQ